MVRSDHVVDIKIRSEDGRIFSVGSYQVAGPENHSMFGEATVPHLLRVSPSGNELASFDGTKWEIRLRDLGPDADFDSYRSLAVGQIKERVHELRWIEDGKAIAIATDKQILVVPTEAAAGRLVPTIIPLKLQAGYKVKSLRANEDGFYIVTQARGFFPNGNLRAYFVQSGRLDVVYELGPKDGTLVGLSTRSDGRVVLALRGAKSSRTVEFRTLSTTPGSFLNVLDSRPCEEDTCFVANWTPGTKRLAVAFHNGTLAWWNEKAGAKAERVVVRPGDPRGTPHSFWANADEDLYLAANKQQVSVFRSDGTLAWTWKPLKGQVHSAHFYEDQQGVLVATSNGIVLVDGGHVKKTLTTFAPQNPSTANGRDARSFPDDVKPLGSGAIAWQDVTETRNMRFGRNVSKRPRLPRLAPPQLKL